MKAYDYVVTDDSGVRKKGMIHASNEEAALNLLRKNHEIILSVTEHLQGRIYFWQKPHLKFEEKMMFTKYMASMIEVGITITEAIETIIDQTKNPNNKQMYKTILEMVRSGQSLGKSLRVYESAFSEIFVNLITTGEESGTLERALQNLDTQLEKEYELRKKVMGAFIYPAVIITITMILTLGIVIFIMPKIIEIFKSFEVILPLPTRLLIGFSTFLTQQTLWAILLTIGIVIGTTTLFRIKALKPIRNAVFIRVPVFGRLIIYANLSRFSRTLNALLSSGIPITEALNTTSRTVGNSEYQKIIQHAQEKVEKGGKLGKALEENEKLFPPLVTKMIRIGEKTGSLEKTTDHLARLYERDVDNLTKNLSVLLEPFLLAFMGLLVGGIAVSIILPIYQLPNLIGQ